MCKKGKLNIVAIKINPPLPQLPKNIHRKPSFEYCDFLMFFQVKLFA